MAEGKEKCCCISYEIYKQKKYIEDLKNIAEVRNTYKSRFGQRTFAGNYSHDNKYSKTNWMCKCDKSKEKEKHIISFNCPVYADIRANYQDFNEDQDLVAYFNQVLESRDRIDSMEQDGAGRRISMPRRGGLRPPPYLYIQDSGLLAFQKSWTGLYYMYII